MSQNQTSHISFVPLFHSLTHSLTLLVLAEPCFVLVAFLLDANYVQIVEESHALWFSLVIWTNCKLVIQKQDHLSFEKAITKRFCLKVAAPSFADRCILLIRIEQQPWRLPKNLFLCHVEIYGAREMKWKKNRILMCLIYVPFTNTSFSIL